MPQSVRRRRERKGEENKERDQGITAPVPARGFKIPAAAGSRLPKLSLRELLALAKLLGCPSCGSTETVMVRLLAQRELRLELARFTDNPGGAGNSYKRESLREMCRETGIWRSGNKRAFSAGLLNWRDRCRARGQAILAEMRSLTLPWNEAETGEVAIAPLQFPVVSKYRLPVEGWLVLPSSANRGA
jgi:hypothetical protein